MSMNILITGGAHAEEAEGSGMGAGARNLPCFAALAALALAAVAIPLRVLPLQGQTTIARVRKLPLAIGVMKSL
jgi:hypothetical protein